MNEVPTVTVLIPARNEEADIERCLRAVLAQDYPHDRMEIVLVDGGSTDRTADIAARVLAEGDIDWKIVENRVGTTPSNLNAGLAVSTGGLLCRVDARSVIPPHYVRLTAEVLTFRSDVAVTGGAQVAIAVDDSPRTIGIARALNNRYAMGGAAYRSGAGSGPSDTVYLGAFRTADVREAGGWDEALLTNQDYELNRRLGRDRVVWFDARLAVGYVPRCRIRDLWRQYYRFGRWKVRYWHHSGDRPRPRQWLLLMAGPAVATLLGAVTLAPGPRIVRALVASALGATALGVVEQRGAKEPVAGTAAHVVAAVAMVAVGAGWLAGVYRSALIPVRHLVTSAPLERL